MSYYQSNYYQNPHPHYWGNTDIGEPVPGWGLSPVMAGPAYVGVGQVRETRQTRVPTRGGAVEAPRKQLGAVGWIVIAGALGAALGVAQNRGMLAKVGLRR